MTRRRRAEAGDAAHRPTVGPEALVEVLDLEARLLGELAGILKEQRAGVSSGDVDRVNDSVFAAHRVLRTMSEARRRRRTLLKGLTGSEDVTLEEFESALGKSMTDDVRRVRDEVRRIARALSRDVAVNRKVLRGAIQSGDDLIRAITDAEATAATYDAETDPAARPRQGGTIINRKI